VILPPLEFPADTDRDVPSHLYVERQKNLNAFLLLSLHSFHS